MANTSPGSFRGERFNVTLLAICHALFNITAITVMTLSGLVGQTLASDPDLATLPVAAMMFGTLITLLVTFWWRRHTLFEPLPD